MKVALKQAAANSDIMHTNGLWAMPNVYPGWSTEGTECKLVVSPRGMLQPWARNHKRFKKSLFWRMIQRSSIEGAAMFHATAETEYDSIRASGFQQPVIVLPNGIDLPPLREPRSRSRTRRQLLFLARIHPIKGLDILLRSWKEVEAQFPTWELKIVGPDNEGYLATMRNLASGLDLQRASFAGPAYGSDKQAALAAADLYILPTHTENFGVTIAEALAASLPVIVGRGAPWQRVEERGCGWWIENSVQEVTTTLRKTLSLSTQELDERGRRGRRWMEEEFSWSGIAEDMAAAYQWIRKGGSPPDCVRTD